MRGAARKAGAVVSVLGIVALSVGICLVLAGSAWYVLRPTATPPRFRVDVYPAGEWEYVRSGVAIVVRDMRERQNICVALLDPSADDFDDQLHLLRPGRRSDWRRCRR